MSDVPEMVERVAKALCAADGEPWDELNEDDNGQLISFPADRKWYRMMACAALEGAREPSYALPIVALEIIRKRTKLVRGPDHEPVIEFDPGMMFEVWRAMVDAAIAKPD